MPENPKSTIRSVMMMTQMMTQEEKNKANKVVYQYGIGRQDTGPFSKFIQQPHFPPLL